MQYTNRKFVSKRVRNINIDCDVYSLDTLERRYIEIAFSYTDDVFFEVKKISVKRTCSFQTKAILVQ